MKGRLVALAGAIVLVSSGCAWMQRASQTDAATPTGSSDRPAFSADGRYIAYSSFADTSAPGVTYGVYRWDTTTNVRTLVSVSSTGDLPDDSSGEPSISADGRYVAFSSDADNLVPNDTNGVTDVFVRDVVAGTTQRVSVLANGGELADASYTPSISADGSTVAMISESDDLSTKDNNLDSDAYVINRTTHAATLVSIVNGVQPDFGVSQVAMSGNGQFVAFTTDTDLVASDANVSDDVYVRDLVAKTVVRITKAKNGDISGGGGSDPSFSSDGRYLAFTGSEDIDGVTDSSPGTEVFERDSTTGTIKRVSVTAAGAPLTGQSSDPVLSGNGRRVAYTTTGNPSGTDTNGSTPDVVVTDLDMNRTWIVSTDWLLNQRPVPSRGGAISADGRYAAFLSTGQFSFDDANSAEDVFVRAIDVPTISSISPTSAARGSTVTFTVNGTGFLNGAKGIPLQGVYTPGASTFVSGSKITVTLTIDPNAPTGQQTFYAENPGTGPGPNAGTLGQCNNCLRIT
ncbi:MAG: TolB family protein [Acidimicrobiia bacterium]